MLQSCKATSKFLFRIIHSIIEDNTIPTVKYEIKALNVLSGLLIGYNGSGAVVLSHEIKALNVLSGLLIGYNGSGAVVLSPLVVHPKPGNSLSS
jgi:hypothetical protein